MLDACRPFRHKHTVKQLFGPHIFNISHMFCFSPSLSTDALLQLAYMLCEIMHQHRTPHSLVSFNRTPRRFSSTTKIPFNFNSTKRPQIRNKSTNKKLSCARLSVALSVFSVRTTHEQKNSSWKIVVHKTQPRSFEIKTKISSERKV